MLYTIVCLCEHGQILDLAPPILYGYYIVAVVVKQYIKLNKRKTNKDTSLIGTVPNSNRNRGKIDRYPHHMYT